MSNKEDTYKIVEFNFNISKNAFTTYLFDELFVS